MEDVTSEMTPVAVPAGRQVVVGFNGTDHSRTALRWAAAEAARCGAPLLVLFAANYPGMTVEPLEPGALAMDEELTAEGVREAMGMHPGLRVRGVTEVTSPSQALTEAASFAEMVVVGTRGYGRVGGALLGSVAFNVAARAPSPIVVVKDEPKWRAAEDDVRIVVGVDGSSEADAAATFAATRARVTSATLELVTCTGDHPVAAVDAEVLHRHATTIVRTAADRVASSFPGLSVAARVEDGAPERTLVDSSAGAEMVVVGTRGRGAFTGMLLGSVSHAVVHGAHCPVAVV